MQSLINGIILVILTIWIARIYLHDSKKMRTITFPYQENTKYILSPNLYFCIFTVCTAPMYLHPFSLIKYGIWLAVILLLIASGKIKLKFNAVTITYIIFLSWAILSISYTKAHSPEIAFNSLLRFSLPIFYLWLGYNAIESKYSLLLFSRITLKTILFYIFWIGGISAVYFPFIYSSPIGNGIFLTYAGFADYLTSLAPLTLFMYFITKRKIYILISLLMVISTILEAVRTGLGGLFIAFSLIIISLYRIRSVFPLIAIIFTGISIIAFVPSIRDKMFYKENETTFQEVATGEVMNKEDIRDNGRYELWERSLEYHYKGRELTGSGIGSTTQWLRMEHERKNTPALLHDDYVLILCEMGLIGLILFIIFSLTFIYNCVESIFSPKTNLWVRMGATIAFASYGGILFSMGFDNVFGHSMTSIINPFIFMGFFIKLKELYSKENEQAYTIIPKS